MDIYRISPRYYHWIINEIRKIEDKVNDYRLRNKTFQQTNVANFEEEPLPADLFSLVFHCNRLSNMTQTNGNQNNFFIVCTRASLQLKHNVL